MYRNRYQTKHLTTTQSSWKTKVFIKLQNIFYLLHSLQNFAKRNTLKGFYNFYIWQKIMKTYISIHFHKQQYKIHKMKHPRFEGEFSLFFMISSCFYIILLLLLRFVFVKLLFNFVEYLIVGKWKENNNIFYSRIKIPA